MFNGYLIIGSNGFAQVGDPAYHEKWKVERAVLQPLMPEVPDEFKGMAQIGVKTFPHDVHRYHEFVVTYSERVLYAWEDKCEDEYDEKVNRFWEWANKCEALNLETEEITDQIIRKWTEIEPLTVVHSLAKNNDVMVQVHGAVA